MDMALEDVIAKNKRGGGGGRGRGAGRARGGSRGGNVGNRGGGQFARTSRVPEGSWRGGMGGRVGVGAGFGSTKIEISNLDYGVSDDDIRELFSEFGVTRKACVNYDASGRSQGTAQVIYERRGDALQAMRQYNGVPLDGKPMIIEIIGGNAGGGGARPASAGANRSFGGTPSPRRGRGTATRGTRGGRRSAGDGERSGKSQVTVEDLDKELEEYSKK